MSKQEKRRSVEGSAPAPNRENEHPALREITASGALAQALPYPKLLRYLLTLLDREIGACGLDTPPGVNAQVAKLVVLTALAKLKMKNSK